MDDPETSPPPTAAHASAALVLSGAGLVYVALGVVIAAVVALGGMRSALFPTGWIFPVLLILSGCLMVVRRRFDVVATLWAGFTLAVFVLAALVYTNALELGLDDAAAFDASILAAGFGLVVLVLRPGFRS